MANKNNIEIELKYRIKNRQKLINWLKKNAGFIFSNRQTDEYYTPAHENFFKEKRPRKYLRIRKSNDKWSTAYKYWHPSGKRGEYSHCDEFETEVIDGNQLRKIFSALGFKLLVKVDKIRTTYRYKDFEIEIDEVKGLGSVCEIEFKGRCQNPEEALAKIKSFAESLGFKETGRGEDLKLGYAYMIAKKKNIFTI